MDSEYRNTALTIIAAIIISFIIIIYLYISVIPSYLYSSNRAVNIFNFYDHVESDKIFFIGSSLIASDVDARMIDKDAFNLGSSSDTPLRRLVELKKLIETKPRAVIIGLTYSSLNESSFAVSGADQIAPVADIIKIGSRELFSKEELKLIDANPTYYNRKFISAGLLALIYRGESNWNMTNFNIPENHKKNSTYEELMDKLKDKTRISNYAVSEEDCNQKSALNYTISELKKAGIQVIVINMPLNPLLSEKISNETRKNYSYFLNSTGVEYYDFERSCPIECFADLTHLNDAGRTHFTELLCTIVR